MYIKYKYKRKYVDFYTNKTKSGAVYDHLNAVRKYLSFSYYLYVNSLNLKNSWLVSRYYTENRYHD